MSRTLGALLAGGSSRRMGEPKERLDLAGRPLAGWAAASLANVAQELVQVGGEPIPGLDLEVWPDLRPDSGPAAGIEAALLGARSAVVVCAVDTPFVPPGLLRAALRAIRQGAMACVPYWQDRWHPLCGAYAPDVLPFLSARLDDEQFDFRGMLDSIAVWPLRGPALSGFGNPERMLLNVNSPVDLEAAHRLCGI
jgi:molybdopterin-guanine dinucleotide biosynthesis protein A